MSKGNYCVVDRRGVVVGHYVYTEGEGWIYCPLPVRKPWVELDA